MLSTGVDIIEIKRIAAVLERYGDRFLHRIYTPGELEYCRGRPSNLASRFAAKEATMKALGTGVRGVGWKDIEIVRAPSGASQHPVARQGPGSRPAAGRGGDFGKHVRLAGQRRRIRGYPPGRAVLTRV